jgi:hypothetical protein
LLINIVKINPFLYISDCGMVLKEHHFFIKNLTLEEEYQDLGCGLLD